MPGEDDSASSITTASFGSMSPMAFEERERLHRRLAGERPGLGLEGVALGQRRLARGLEPVAGGAAGAAGHRGLDRRVSSGSVLLGSPRIATCAG